MFLRNCASLSWEANDATVTSHQIISFQNSSQPYFKAQDPDSRSFTSRDILF